MLKAIFVAVCLAIGAGLTSTASAQGMFEPLVIVADRPGGIDIDFGMGIFGGEEAVATTTLNVREGPGTRHPVLGVLRPGQDVIVTSCRSGWCSINWRGPSGWVSERYLRRTSADAGIIVPGLQRVCFYDDVQFRGRSLCVFPGASNNNLGVWGNRIASIRNRGHAIVEVCTDSRFRDCEIFDSSVPMLPWWLDQNILSFRVFD